MALEFREASGSAGPSRRPLVLAIVAVVLQLTLGTQVTILGGAPNFLVAYAVSLSLRSEPRRAVLVAFACGLVNDLTAAVPLGLMTLLLTVSCFTLSTMTRGMLAGLTTESFRLAAMGILAVNAVYAVAVVVLGVEGSILTSLLGHGAATTALDLACCAAFMALGRGGQGSSRGFSPSARGTRFKIPR